MMKGKGRNKTVLLLFIPLLFSTISTFLVYSGHFSNYYASYNNLLQTTFPDYALVAENNTLLLEPDFNTESFLTDFELNEVSYVGKLRCNLSINSNNYKIVLYWAPEEFFAQHSKIGGEQNKILLDESFISLEGLEINQIITLNFSSESNLVETSLPVSNFVSVEDVFTDELLRIGWADTFREQSLFLVSETFYEIFEEFIESITIYYIALFEFSDAFLNSRHPHQMVNYLGKKRQELDYYFGYSYDDTNMEEETIRYFSLERGLYFFTIYYREYTLTRVMFFYVISFSFCYIVINNTTQTFIRSQKERIRISYLRGSRRSNLLLNFTGFERRAIVISIFFSFIASIVVLGVFTPSLLGFAYYYGMNLLISCLIAVFYGSIQLLILSNHLKEIYKEGEKEENVPLNKLSTFLGKTLPWLLFNLSLGFSFFFLFFTGILKFEMDFYSGISLIVISVLFTLFLNIIMLKKTILWIGKKVVSLSYIFSKLSKQTIKLSRRFIKDSYRMIQLLILFLIICTFFLSSFDTINNFNSLNNDLNQVGDVIISFHPEKGDIVNSYLSPYVNISAEVQLLVSEFKTLTEPGPISHYGFIFLINSSKISQIFDSKAFKDKYFGNYIASEISNELIDDCDLVVVNKALAELVSTQQSDAFYIPIPTKNGENNLLRTTVLDIARFVPYFSGISGEKPFSILNSEIITNATELQVKTMHHIIWLKENISKTVFKDNIQTINKNYNTHIEIIDQFEFPIITDYYWVPSVFRQFMLSLLTVFTVCLFFLFLAFYSDTIDKQMKGFRIFFARGLSFKKGIFLSMLPLFLFTLFYIVFSYIAGLILSFVMFSSIQPKYYLRIPFSVFPFSFTFLSAQIILLGAILIVSGITSYLKLRKQIPEVKFNVPSVFQEEEGII